ncbi:MAG TPA: NAD(P)/FAD-dependent oxidoreductase [Mycobacteriales bacterium]|nr:NAD(P)/FAD-dependent oxidoreductase [Mycobacteriales bacterium]
MTDVVVIGAGHNALVCATLLARAGLAVTVLEERDAVGGAAKTEAPFPRVPGLRQSTGAYLLGLMPPELVRTLGVDLPLLRRDPHYFLPTTGSSYLLMGSDRDAVRRNYEAFFSPADWRADEALQAELDALREDLAPAWLAEVGSVEDVAERYVRPALREAFVALCRGSVADYLARFGFASEQVVAMYAVTDGLSGLAAGPDTPGSGHNFLVHNMCRLPGADGTWMIVRGGMGTVTATIADAARAAGATIRTGSLVARVLVEDGAAAGVALASGEEVRAPVVVGGCDPYRLMDLVGERFPEALRARMTSVALPGSTLKVNLALRDLPRFACLPDGAASPFGATIHLLPDGGLDAVRAQWADVQAGRLPDFPTIEWYVHTTVDPSLRDEAGHHSSALFVQSVPYGVEDDGYVDHLLSVCDRFAPGTSGLVADTFALWPSGIERHFGITRGHIHHVDNAVAFADRMPYATGLDGLYACSAGCHPAGSVIGAAGHNAARRVLADLGRG